MIYIFHALHESITIADTLQTIKRSLEKQS